MILGELAPKNLAITHADEVAKWLSRSTLIYRALTAPLIALFDGAANRLLRLIGIHPIQELPEGATVAEALVAALGFRPWFRAQKQREEYDLDEAHVTIDETPMGVFVEIEAPGELIAPVAAKLGRSSADYRLESYPRLWRDWCAANNLPPQDMLLPTL